MNVQKYVVLFLAVCCLFSGCSSVDAYPNDNIYHFETDAQIPMYSCATERSFAESEDGYYFVLTIRGNHFLFFADKETMEVLPLCGKPNCLHYEEPDFAKRQLCNSFYYGVLYRTSVYYNNGKLYIPVGGGPQKYIYEFSLDGSERKQLFSLSGTGTGTTLLFHRGYCYEAVTEYDEEMHTVMRIVRHSLDAPRKEPECIFEKEAEAAAGEEKGTIILGDIKAYGNRLYFTTDENGKTGFYFIDLTDPDFAAKPIFDQVEESTDARFQVFPSSNGLLAALNLLDEPQPEGMDGSTYLANLPSVLYRSDLQGNDVKKWKETLYSPFTWDDRYVYKWPWWPCKQVDPPGNKISIYDLDGNLLVEHDADTDVPDIEDIYVSMGEHVFLFGESRNKVYYFAKSEIETGEIHPKLLIDCSQYE